VEPDIELIEKEIDAIDEKMRTRFPELPQSIGRNWVSPTGVAVPRASFYVRAVFGGAELDSFGHDREALRGRVRYKLDQAVRLLSFYVDAARPRAALGPAMQVLRYDGKALRHGHDELEVVLGSYLNTSELEGMEFRHAPVIR
jgi:hypothetical protein